MSEPLGPPNPADADEELHETLVDGWTLVPEDNWESVEADWTEASEHPSYWRNTDA